MHNLLNITVRPPNGTSSVGQRRPFHPLRKNRCGSYFRCSPRAAPCFLSSFFSESAFSDKPASVRSPLCVKYLTCGRNGRSFMQQNRSPHSSSLVINPRTLNIECSNQRQKKRHGLSVKKCTCCENLGMQFGCQLY